MHGQFVLEILIQTSYKPPLGNAIEKSSSDRCKATWKTEFKLPWREAGPCNHHDGDVDSDQ